MEELINDYVECEIAVNKIFYPKYVTSTNSGDYCIFLAMITKPISGKVVTDKSMKHIKLKGNCPALEFGSTYVVRAKLEETNEKYGDTYTILFMNKKINLSDKHKQKEFLSYVLTEQQVEDLFNTYDDVLEILDREDINALCKVKGIKEATAMRIIENYKDCKDYSSVYLELGQLGLTENIIKKVVNHYNSPDTAIDKIRNDPYNLIEVDGIGFKKADEIALKVGVEKFDIRRVGGYMKHLLREQGEQGRSWLSYDEIIKNVYDTLGYVPDDVISSVAKVLIDSNVVKVLDNGEKIMLTRFYNLEKNIAKELLRLMYNDKYEDANKKIEERKNANEYYLDEEDVYTPYIPMDFDFSNLEDRISEINKNQGYELTDEQKEGIYIMRDNNVVAITGGAGVGKSSSANAIMKILNPKNYICCALSGKASVRITEATGLEASTIHRALDYSPIQGKFMYDSKNQFCADVVLIDEATMPNGDLYLGLLRAIPTGAKVILMGDVQQLTPIGNCQVFADILSSNIIPSVKLTKPHRQALKSGIIPTSINIAQQKQIFKSGFVGNEILGELQDMELDIYDKSKLLSPIVVNKYLEELDKVNGDLMKVQICVATRVKGDLSCYNLNTLVQSKLTNYFNLSGNTIEVVIERNKKNPELNKVYTIHEGDKVINVKNCYTTYNEEDEITPIFNGNIGIVLSIDDKGNSLVNFEGIGKVIMDKNQSKNLELAYALGCHKMQGSSGRTVIVGIDNGSYIMNTCELLYTAITRAEKYCVLIAHNNAIKKCISNKEVNKKQTLLQRFLLENKTN